MCAMNLGPFHPSSPSLTLKPFFSQQALSYYSVLPFFWFTEFNYGWLCEQKVKFIFFKHGQLISDYKENATLPPATINRT